MKRFFPVLLVLMLFMPVSAAEVTPVDVLYDTASVSRWNAYFGSKPFGELSVSEGWQLLDGPVRVAGVGALDSHATLERRLLAFERKYAEVRHGILQTFVNVFLDVDAVRAVIDFDESLGIYRMKDERSGIWIVSADGSFPYYSPDSSVNPDTGETSVSLGGQWIPYRQVNWSKTNVLTEYSLYDLGYALRDIGQGNDVKTYSRDGDPLYQYIRSAWTAGAVGDYYVYCDSSGNPYVSRIEPDEWAQEQDNDYIVDDDGNTVNGQLIDVDTSTVWFPDGTLNFINNLVYDESQKTYYVDASSSYDIDNNYYYTYNYHYEYHIDYTSITYIGQTAEYDEVYEYYYQLPDGRSSADLTVEELQALNTQIDVLPYIRSADDTSIRALYHFDGDTRDSSYWSHLGEFSWNKGASITYMDAGAFNGALYLDENEHDFSVTLPSALGSGDFTIQWRYYQSNTLTPVIDSTFGVSGATLLQFDGANVRDAAGAVLSPVSVGNWQEIAVMRENGVMTVFLNGVSIGYSIFGDSLGKTLEFKFGADQETYKYLDELRVTNKAVYSTFGYTPTSVPFDTNLALVLPDSQLPLADEYWSISSSGTNLLTEYGMDWWTEMAVAGNQYIEASDKTPIASSSTEWDGNTVYNFAGAPDFPVWGYLDAVTDVVVDGGTSLISNYYEYVATGYRPYTAVLDLFSVPTGGLTDSVAYGLVTELALAQSGTNYRHLAAGDYVFSIVTGDGHVTSLSFNLQVYCNNSVPVYVDGNGYRLSFFINALNESNLSACLAVQPLEYDAPASKIVYMELVEGTSTDLTAEFVSSVVVMDKDDLNTPSLAVRTDLDITSYQIGGVRPSLPEKGLVWAMVENGRITSLQIYNGQAWEEVDGRIWTGSRWIPYYAYDVLLLKDMYDIVESDPSLNPIYTETGFWTWLQSAWKDMIARLDKLIALGGGGGGATLPPDASTQFPGAEDDPTTEDDEGWTIIDLAVTLKDGVWTIVKGVVKVGVGGFSGLVDGVSSIGGFFDTYDPDSPDGIFAIPVEEDESLWN